MVPVQADMSHSGPATGDASARSPAGQDQMDTRSELLLVKAQLLAMSRMHDEQKVANRALREEILVLRSAVRGAELGTIASNGESNS
ncbi:non-specific serine/threonine protein kinase [Plasmodiophora brassicae]